MGARRCALLLLLLKCLFHMHRLTADVHIAQRASLCLQTSKGSHTTPLPIYLVTSYVSPHCLMPAGAQALVAWYLSKADPTARLSMIAEEASAFIR